jgi:hypothetical protein
MGCFAKCDARLEVHQGGKAPQQALQDALLGASDTTQEYGQLANIFLCGKDFFPNGRRGRKPNDMKERNA